MLPEAGVQMINDPRQKSKKALIEDKLLCQLVTSGCIRCDKNALCSAQLRCYSVYGLITQV